MIQLRNVAISPLMVRDLKLSTLLQSPILFVTMLLLDGGDLARWTGAALLGHWLGVAAIALKRTAYQSSTDRFFVRWGSIPLIVIAWVSEPAIHHYLRW